VKQVHPEEIRRVLIRATNWVGDAVMSIPAMREIRRRFPEARISLLVRPWVKDVYGAIDFVDEILIYDKAGAHRGWAGLRKLAAGLRSRRFDIAILLPNAMEAALIAFWARIPIRLGYARDGRAPLLTHAVRINPEVLKVHQAYYYLGILAGAGLMPARPWAQPEYQLDAIGIRVGDADRKAARALLESRGVKSWYPVVGLNPGAAYGGAKRWPADRFAAVADILVSQWRAQIVVVGSAGEKGIAGEVVRAARSPLVSLAGETTLGQLMGLMLECDLFITNDSGPMHLAAALDVPQLAIFGSTSEVATGPLSRCARVLKHPVACNPCFLRECPTDFQCMLGLGIKEVAAAAGDLLAKSADTKKVPG